MSVLLRRLVVLAALALALTGAGTIATAAPAQAAAPPIGSVVCHAGPVSGLQCGVVTAINLTINYPGGTIHGVFRYEACSQPGDGGAPIYQLTTGAQVGTVLGSAGACRTFGLPLS